MTTLASVWRTDIRLRLSKDQMLAGSLVGCTRQVDNLFKPGLHNTYDAPPEQAFQFHVIGALGEIAVASHYDLPWPPALGDYHAPDVGGAQVRSSGRPLGALIVHKRDSDDEPFILVSIEGAMCVLRGWILGADAKHMRYWRDDGGVRHPAFFVPQDDLLPMADLQLPWRKP